MTEVSDNAFLGGQLNILQPRNGYRAGADPVFLAAAVDVSPGQHVLDLGCGVGTAMLCLLVRVPGVAVTGVELQADLVRLAQENLERNRLAGTVFQADIKALPRELRDRSFDHVMTNPPFFDRQSSSPAPDAGREQGRGETVTMRDWFDSALRRLVPGGRLTLVNRIERLPECLAILSGRTGDIVVLPLAARPGRSAKLFLLSARKGAKGAFRLMPQLVLHEGVQHDVDRDSYTQAAQRILRDGAALPLAD